MRQSDDVAPTISVMTRDQLAARLAEDRDEDATQAADYALWVRALALFELAPDDYDVQQADADVLAELSAVYMARRKEVVVIEDANTTAEIAVQTLSHELVHALQDAELDLGAYGERWETSFDARLAIAAIIEGEATLYESLVQLQLHGVDPERVDWQRAYNTYRSKELIAAERDAAPVTMARVRFPYAFGGAFVTAIWRSRGRAGIDQLFEHPPRSTRDIMFGPGSGDADQARMQLYEHGLPVLPAMLQPRLATPLGAWIMRVFAGHTFTPIELRLNAPRGLRADVFSVQLDPDTDVVAASWRASFTDGTAVAHWPASNGPPPGVVAAALPDTLDAFALASETALPEDLSALSWNAIAEPKNEDNEAPPRSAGAVPLVEGADMTAARRWNIPLASSFTTCRTGPAL